MKKKIIIVLPAFCLLMVGYENKQHAFLKEYAAISEEIVRIVDANPTAEGVEKAQNYLNSKKVLLNSNFDASSMKKTDKNIEDKFRVIVLGI